jgi:diguanylate cyclase (GGDEF)-like protein
MDSERDPGYLRFRRGTVRLASFSSLGTVAMIVAYAVATWDDGANRDLVAGLALVAFLSVVVVEALRVERLVETRWCDVFFGTWSGLYIVVIALLALADGGVESPLSMTFFAVLVFAGLCYPLRLAVQVGVGCVAGYLAVGIASPQVHFDGPLYIAGVLALVAVMCSWQAQTLERQRRELADASVTDHLTSALNRRGFHDHVERELARAERSGDPVALVLVDLDGFKGVNDRHGHAAGDELLCWVVGRLRAGLRPSDAAGRLGGDEFALLLPGTAGAGAEDVAGRLRAALAERTSASFGIAVYPARRSADALLAHADAQLYREKMARRSAPAQAPGIQVPDGFWA